MLLSPPATILAEYIRSEGLMTDPDDSTTWPLYVSRMPDSGVKNNVGAIYDTPGKKDGRLMAGTVIQHYGLRIKIRCTVYNTGWAKIEEIATNLDTVKNEVVSVGGNNYIIENISRVEPVVPLGAEDGTKERQMFISDFLVTMKIV